VKTCNIEGWSIEDVEGLSNIAKNIIVYVVISYFRAFV
jgi:hypothetical protein